ncbi:MAG: alpha-E domain-containing protein [Candidatus Binatia bacterium]
MLSRIADSLYWMSRYLERAGNTARLVEINLLHLLEAEDALPEVSQWRPLLSISDSEEAYKQRYDGGEITAGRTIQFMTRERANPNSIRSSLRLARENARVVRDRISNEMWEAINEMWLHADRAMEGASPSGRAPGLYAEVRNGVARFHGISVSTMMRGEAFGFYLLGTCAERADMTARLLDVKYHLLLPDVSMVGSALDYYQWAALLKSLSGFEAYRRRYQAGLRPVDIAEFVIFERDFPRSLRFCVERMRHALHEIGGDGSSDGDRGVVAAMAELHAHLEQTAADQVLAAGLHEYLDDFLAKIATVHAGITRAYFEHYLGVER